MCMPVTELQKNYLSLMSDTHIVAQHDLGTDIEVLGLQYIITPYSSGVGQLFPYKNVGFWDQDEILDFLTLGTHYQ